MSLVSGNPIRVASVPDYRTSFPDWSLPAKQGPASVSYLRQSATSLGNDIGFDSITPPNPGSNVIGRDIIWHNKVRIKLNWPPAAGVGVTIGSDTAPRALPFNSLVSTASLTLNNQTFTVSQWDKISAALQRFNARGNTFKYAHYPFMPETVGRYSQAIGSMLDVISTSANNEFDTPRGGYSFVSATNIVDGNGDSIGAHVILETWEPVNLAPFLYGVKEAGIPYVQTMGLRFTLNGEWGRLLSRMDNARAVTSVELAVDAANPQVSELFYESIASPMLEKSLPTTISFPYHRILVSTIKGGAAGYAPAAFANVRWDGQ